MAVGLPMATESASPLTAMVDALLMATVMTVVADPPMAIVMAVGLPMATESASPLTVMVAGLPSGIEMTVVVNPPLVIESASPLTEKAVLPLMLRRERESPLPSLTVLTSSKIPVPEVMKRKETRSSGSMTKKRVMTDHSPNEAIQKIPSLAAWDFLLVCQKYSQKTTYQLWYSLLPVV